MVRSILLRGFDQQMAIKIGDNMDAHGVNMVRECVTTSIERIEEGATRKMKVLGPINVYCICKFAVLRWLPSTWMVPSM